MKNFQPKIISNGNNDFSVQMPTERDTTLPGSVWLFGTKQEAETFAKSGPVPLTVCAKCGQAGHGAFQCNKY